MASTAPTVPTTQAVTGATWTPETITSIGNVLDPLVWIIGFILLYRILKHGPFKAFAWKWGDKSGSLSKEGGSLVALSPSKLTTIIHLQRIDITDRAWSDMRTYVHEAEDDFYQIMASHGADPLSGDLAATRMSQILSNAADRNHIMDQMRDGELVDSYINNKMEMFAKRYSHLAMRPGLVLPDYQDIRNEVLIYVTHILKEFAHIGTDAQVKLRATCDTYRGATDDKDVIDLIETISSGKLGKWE